MAIIMDFKVTYEYENEVIAHKITKYNVSKVSEKFIIITDDKLYGFGQLCKLTWCNAIIIMILVLP